MAKKRQRKLTVKYPQHAFKPEDLLGFIEDPGFTDEWDNELGLSDHDLEALQIGIMAQPKCGAVIPGTGGARKLRFTPDDWHKGKRGSVRVIYSYFERYGLVYLIVAYAKSEHDDISEAGKTAIAKLMKEIAALLKERYGY